MVCAGRHAWVMDGQTAYGLEWPRDLIVSVLGSEQKGPFGVQEEGPLPAVEHLVHLALGLVAGCFPLRQQPMEHGSLTQPEREHQPKESAVSGLSPKRPHHVHTDEWGGTKAGPTRLTDCPWTVSRGSLSPPHRPHTHAHTKPARKCGVTEARTDRAPSPEPAVDQACEEAVVPRRIRRPSPPASEFSLVGIDREARGAVVSSDRRADHRAQRLSSPNLDTTKRQKYANQSGRTIE